MFNPIRNVKPCGKMFFPSALSDCGIREMGQGSDLTTRRKGGMVLREEEKAHFGVINNCWSI